MTNQHHYNFTLRLGDNALIVSHRLGEWVGKGPELEEEMAMANFALDFLGQARLFYTLAAELAGRGESEDDLAFLRDTMDYQSVLLVEQPNGNFADTVARQFLFESFYAMYLEQLAGSGDERIAAIAAKAAKEVNYHVRHFYKWIQRLGDGTEQSHVLMQDAIDALWKYTGELFVTDSVEQAAMAAGVAPDPATFRPRWRQFVDEALTEATLSTPADEWMASGGKQGRHSEIFGYMLADMQFMQRAYPGAKW
jgi:ring-1,2-phenylacetyl-CoA epoxidase subunit PaaC